MITMDDKHDGDPLGLSFEDAGPNTANIKVVGVGGGGGNAINRMIAAKIDGVQFLAANTDCQALSSNRAAIKLQLGAKLTKGLGAGGNPEVGRSSALEDTESVLEDLAGADMVFVTAGLGGGTGTGAAPIIANLSREMGALVVAVVTLPFSFEGRRRRKQAEEGLAALREVVDTVITIPNDKLLHTVEPGTPINEAFTVADDILRQAVQGISDLITIPGEINLDFADVKSVMSGMGMALMGTGVAEGEHRAVEAAQRAISSPLLEDASIHGARGVLINVTGGEDMSLHEVSQAAEIIQEAADPDANIIFGAVIDRNSKGTMKVTVIATGFAEEDRLPARRQLVEDIASTRRMQREPAIEPRLDEPQQRREAARGQGQEPAGSRFFRPGAGEGLDFDANDDGFTPNFGKSRDDLDVPSFLRKQMD